MKHTLSLFILLSTGFLLNSSIPKEMQASEIVVVLNPNNPVTSMTAGEVKLIWLRKIKKRWPQLKKNIKPVDRSHSCTERDLFYNKILDMSADEVETYFIQKQYQNAEKPPEKFSSEKEVIDFVSNEPGAIGFVSSAVAHASKDRVRIVFSF